MKSGGGGSVEEKRLKTPWKEVNLRGVTMYIIWKEKNDLSLGGYRLKMPKIPKEPNAEK